MRRASRTRNRPGFTIMESVIAIAMLCVAMIMVAQIGVRSLAERTNAEEQFVAIEATANVLETARATAWADLTPAWAAALKPTPDVVARLDDVALAVRVEPEKDRPRVKRVTVEVRWSPGERAGLRTITTVGLFADRTARSGS